MFNPIMCTGNMGAGGDAPLFLTYRSEDDTLAVIAGDGYFNDLQNELREGDGLLVAGTDGVSLLRVASVVDQVVTTEVVV